MTTTNDDLVKMLDRYEEEFYMRYNQRERKLLISFAEWVLPQLLNKHDVMRSLPSEQELIGILKECRDLLVMNTLIDKSGQSKALVDKVDSVMNWQ